MALISSYALGGGAAHSGTAAPGSYADAECFTCGAVADTLYMGWSPICSRCETHARESAEERAQEDREEIGDSLCHDCGESNAERIFPHLDGRRIYLCTPCWGHADHEPDYLMFCECRVPQRDYGSDYCGVCVYRIPSEQLDAPPEDEEDGSAFDYLDDEDDDGPPPPEDTVWCECPVPCLEFKTDKVCFFCSGCV